MPPFGTLYNWRNRELMTREECIAGEYLLGVDPDDDFTLLQRLEAVQGVINSCVELVSLRSEHDQDIIRRL